MRAMNDRGALDHGLTAHLRLGQLALLIHQNTSLARPAAGFCARGVARRSRPEADDAAAGFDFARLEVSTRSWLRRRRRVGYGPAAQSRPASARKTSRSGQAVGKKTRMRATPSTTRAAILIRRRRRVLNSA